MEKLTIIFSNSQFVACNQKKLYLCTFFYKDKYMGYNKSFLVGLIFLFSVSCFFSCAKEDVYKAIVIVSKIEETGSSTDMKKVPVPDCKLIFGEENFSPEMQREVYTDASGKYEGEWSLEASLKVLASKEIDGRLYTGASVIRLSLSGTEKVEILITLAE